MSSLFDRLNLRPQERRLVVIVGIILFVVINFFLVFPMFGQYGVFQQRIFDAKAELAKYQAEIAKRSEYSKQVRELEELGGEVATFEAARRLSEEVNSQAALSGVTLKSVTQSRQRGIRGKTNAFFDEVTVSVNLSSGEKEFVDFLYRLADPKLLIRARSMQLGTDPKKHQLEAQMTLVKSFQRRAPKRRSGAKAAAEVAQPASQTTAPTSESNRVSTGPLVAPVTKPAAGGASKSSSVKNVKSARTNSPAGAAKPKFTRPGRGNRAVPSKLPTRTVPTTGPKVSSPRSQLPKSKAPTNRVRRPSPPKNL